jgi:AcrR family transcriptional regulator
MDIRDKILAAATQVYAEGGFQGATTRRVAELAGVNEVTIFRQFGSKDALMDQVMASIMTRVHATEHPLPPVPARPIEELTSWAVSFHTLLAEHAPIMRKAVGTFDKRRKDAVDALASTDSCEDQLQRYMVALRAHGCIAPEVEARADADDFVGAAASMLMNTVWGDAMWRDLAPDWVFPLPADRAVRCYVEVFARALGLAATDQGHPLLSTTAQSSSL